VEQAKRVPSSLRGDVPIYNHYAQWLLGKQVASNPELAKLENFIFTGVREYTKVVSGSAASVQAPTDAEVKLIMQLMNTIQSPEAFNASASAMLQDMDNVKLGNVQKINDINNNIASFFGAPPARPGATSQPPDAASLRKQYGY
jgi:hypothetical protein